MILILVYLVSGSAACQHDAPFVSLVGLGVLLVQATCVGMRVTRLARGVGARGATIPNACARPARRHNTGGCIETGACAAVPTVHGARTCASLGHDGCASPRDKGSPLWGLRGRPFSSACRRPFAARNFNDPARRTGSACRGATPDAGTGTCLAARAMSTAPASEGTPRVTGNLSADHADPMLVQRT